MPRWSRGYHRVSDDSVSSYGGHATLGDAVADAQRCLLDPDVWTAWVRDPDNDVVWCGGKCQFGGMHGDITFCDAAVEPTSPVAMCAVHTDVVTELRG